MIVASEAREISSRKDERQIERAIEFIDRLIREHALNGETKPTICLISAPALSGLSSSALQSVKYHLMCCGYTVDVSLTRGHEYTYPDHLRTEWGISW